MFGGVARWESVRMRGRRELVVIGSTSSAGYRHPVLQTEEEESRFRGLVRDGDEYRLQKA